MVKPGSRPTSPPVPATGPRQQVKVSLRPDYLAALDAKAKQLGLTRSQLLERLVERAQLVVVEQAQQVTERAKRGRAVVEVEPQFKRQ